jgi:hypothetical protein
VVSMHGPVRLDDAGRSTAAVGTDGVAIMSNPYDATDMGYRFIAVLVIGGLIAASANSLWPDQIDLIALIYGVSLLMAIIPLIVYGFITLVGAVIGTAVALSRPRRTLRATKTVWRTARSNRVDDLVAAVDAAAVRLVIDRDEIRDVTGVRGWLRPHLDIALRSGVVHRISAHPWWRLRLSRLAHDLRQSL